MSELFRKRMALHGGTVSHSLRRQSNEIMNQTFENDLGYRVCKLYSREMELLEENVEIKYQYSQVYTINKDQVEYLVQFRPGYFPEKKYIESDGIERLGFYLEIPDENSGDSDMWLILGRNDKNSFIRYNILKCNWTFKWITDGIIHSCLGVLRNRNSYSSGVWSDGFFTTVDNQSQFIVPTTQETSKIDYNQRFILSDSIIRPLVYEVSKIEDTFPCGTIKFTMKQDHYNEATDNAELKICDYYKTPILPQEPEKEYFTLKFSGTTPVLILGGAARTISTVSEHDLPKITWSYSFDDKEGLVKEDLSEDFIITETDSEVEISAIKEFKNLGKVIKITATLPLGACADIELEVRR